MTIFFAFSVFAYSNDDIFFKQIESKQQFNSNLFYIDLLALSNTTYSTNVFGLQVNPFFQLSKFVSNLNIRLNYIIIDSNPINSHINYEFLFSYNVLHIAPLTLYVNYAIYSMHKLRYYDFDLEQDLNHTSYGNSYSIGVMANVYNHFSLMVEQRWRVSENNLIKNNNSFYLGLIYRIPIEIFKE